MSSNVAEECEAIRRRMTEFNPGNGFQKIMILLMGMLGHGKSSLVNSCLCVTYDEEYSNDAGSGDSAAPITVKTKEHKLRGPVSIVDNRGLNKLDTDEQMEMALQYNQLRRLGKVHWNRALDQVFEVFIEKITNPPKEFYVPVLVYSIRCLLTERMYKEIEPFIRQAQSITGVFPIIVLTSSGYTGGQQMIGDVANEFRRLGAMNVFGIENYTTENSDRNETTDKVVMTFLKTCLDEAQRIISRSGRIYEVTFLRNSVTQIKENVEHEISKRDKIIKERDEEIKLLKQRIKTLEEKCKLM